MLAMCCQSRLWLLNFGSVYNCCQSGLWLLIFDNVSRVLSQWFRLLLTDNVKLYVKVVELETFSEIRDTL